MGGSPEVPNIPRRRLKVIHEDTFDVANEKLKQNVVAAQKAVKNIKQMVHFTVNELALEKAKAADSEEEKYRREREKVARHQMGEASVADKAAKRAAADIHDIDARLENFKNKSKEWEFLPVDKISDLIKRRVAAKMAKEAWEKKAESQRRFPMKVV